MNKIFPVILPLTGLVATCLAMEPIDVQIPYRIGDGEALKLIFPTEMVAPEQVGQVVEIEGLQVAEPLKIVAKWTSRSQLELAVFGEVDALKLYPLILPELWLDRQGKEQRLDPNKSKWLLGRQGSVLTQDYSWYKDDYKPHIFYIDESLDLDLLQPLIDKAYVQLEKPASPGGETQVPVTLSPVTVQDVLDNWEMINEDLYYGGLGEKTKAKWQEAPPDQIIPGYWKMDYLLLDPKVGDASLMIPGLGRRLAAESSFQPLKVLTQRSNRLDYYVSNKYMGDGLYEVEVKFDCPAMGDDAKSLAQQIKWQLSPYVQVTEGKPKYAETLDWDPQRDAMRIELDEEASELYSLQTGTRKGYKKLIFKVDTKGVPCKLSCHAYLNTMVNQAITEEMVSSTDFCTLLSPPVPYIKTSMSSAGMQGLGARSFKLETRGLRSLRARITRLDATSPRALIRSMDLFKKYYEDARFNELATVMSAQFLPMVLESKEVDLPVGEAKKEQEINLQDAALFPNQEHGLFFIELVGDPHGQWLESHPNAQSSQIFNQNLIQMTDLGLMWKKTGQQFYVYSYRLSTGKPLEQGMVKLLDKNGKVLEEKSLGVMGTLMKIPTLGGVKWMEVSCGEDRYVTEVLNSRDEMQYYYNDFEAYIDSATLPETRVFSFTDRELYRPGEVVHMKGIIRDICGNEISTPSDIEELELVLYQNYSTELARFTASLEADGSFAHDFTMPSDFTGTCRVGIKLSRKGDANKTSKDMLVLRPAQEDLEYLVADYIHGNRTFNHYITVGDYRRNEFELESELKLAAQDRTYRMDVQASNLNGTPLAGGRARWSLRGTATNFYPKGYQDYLFGDHREWDFNLWRVYYQGIDSAAAGGDVQLSQASSELDAEGKGYVELPLKAGSFPRRQLVQATCIVTNGNQQMLSTGQKTTCDPAELYVGLNCPSKHSQAGEGKSLPLKMVVLDTEGTLKMGDQALTVEVSRERKTPYRIGLIDHSQVKKEAVMERVLKQELNCEGGKAQVNIPLAEAGTYEITVSGKDAKGQEFRSAIKHVAWAEGQRPWGYGGREYTDISADRDIYKAGDVAKLLVQSPVEGTVLVSIEREKILRQFLCEIKGENPIIEIPLQKDDVPEVKVSLFIVQGDKGARKDDGLPLVQLSSTTLRLDPSEARLQVQLDVPDKTLQVGDACALSGQVLDAAGQPVAGATLSFYAEDEGSLQAGGYTNPDPLSFFYSDRPYLVRSYSSLNQILGENKEDVDYGNKGVFIGGGFGACAVRGEAADEASSQNLSLRSNFNPCAFWMASLKTDAQGRFSTTVKNPDLLTRYRVIAVAQAGDAQFGVGTGSYEVSKSIILEPSAPLSATLGDSIDVPVTLTMNPKMLPPALQAKADSPVTWRVEVVGDTQSAVSPQSQTVDLVGNVPQTLHVKVDMQQCGDSQLKWVIRAEDAECAALGLSDGLVTDFTIKPPTPYLREAFFTELPQGSTVDLTKLVKTGFDARAQADFVLSPSPLAAAMTGIEALKAYPYLCSEQLSSRLWPLMLADTLEAGMGLPAGDDAERKASMQMIMRELINRRAMGGYFTYWPESNEASIFHASVLHALVRAQQLGYCQFVRVLDLSLAEAKEKLLTIESSGDLSAAQAAFTHPLMLVVLLEAGRLSPEEFKAIIEKRSADKDWQSKEALMMTVIVARQLGLSLADDLRKMVANAKAYQGYGLPSMEILVLMDEMMNDAKSHAFAAKMNKFMRRYANRVYNTTYESAWVVQLLANYIQAAGLDEAKSTIDGKEICAALPLILKKYKLVTDSPMQVEQGHAYAFGVAEGYTKEKQKPELVDKGFRISRQYEKLTDAGEWVASEDFTVGDIVRICLSVKNTTGEEGQYVAVEDYMPAGLELINPAVKGQNLPDGVLANRASCWSWGGYMSYKQYTKDSVRMFINSYPADYTTKVHYIARVVKSGHMTAPAAKAEMMYEPQMHGLSIPMEMKVKAHE